MHSLKDLQNKRRKIKGMRDLRAEEEIVCCWSDAPDKPVVSIFCITYNHERFIEDAIRGFLLQETDFPFEIVVHEDASTDKTALILKKYANAYPRIIKPIIQVVNQYSRGVKPLSLATSLCKGEYIAFCEGDDYWHHREKLQMQLDLMEKNPEMTLCHTGFDILTKFHRRRHEYSDSQNQWPEWGRDTYENLLKDWNVKTPTTMYRASVLREFEASKYNNIEWPFGDGNRFLFASVKGSIGLIGISTAAYRKVSDSAMNQSPKKKMEMKQAHLECVRMFIADYPVDRNLERKILKVLNYQLYYFAFFSARIDIMKCHYNELISFGKKPFPLKNFALSSMAAMKWPIELINTIMKFTRSKIITFSR